MHTDALILAAPAKINLTLEVLGKRPDGYHEVRSVMQTINLCDRIRFETGAGAGVRGDSPGWSAGNSLVSEALRLMQSRSKAGQDVLITVEKRIPLSSGLGGDSSDAAAVLRGLTQLWKPDLKSGELQAMARQLGSDVSFFLEGGACLLEGRGEKVTPLPALARCWVIVINPGIPRPPNKTAFLYAALKSEHFTDGAITARLVSALKADQPVSPGQIFNTFENIAFARGSELAVYRSHLLKIGAPAVHLAGSGPALFTLLEDKQTAEEILLRLKNQGMESYLAETSGLDCGWP